MTHARIRGCRTVNKPEIGTIIHGTLRTEDLVEAFSAEYERLGGESKWIKHFRNVVFGRDLAASHEEELEWALEDLFNLLQLMAPEGAYFGSHAGDGSDFGFWPDYENNGGWASTYG